MDVKYDMTMLCFLPTQWNKIEISSIHTLKNSPPFHAFRRVALYLCNMGAASNFHFLPCRNDMSCLWKILADCCSGVHPLDGSTVQLFIQESLVDPLSNSCEVVKCGKEMVINVYCIFNCVLVHWPPLSLSFKLTIYLILIKSVCLEWVICIWWAILSVFFFLSSKTRRFRREIANIDNVLF